MRLNRREIRGGNGSLRRDCITGNSGGSILEFHDNVKKYSHLMHQPLDLYLKTPSPELARAALNEQQKRIYGSYS